MDKNSHISIATILQDISDTEKEIVTMTQEAEGYELIGDRMSMFKAGARINGIKERKEFIKKIKKILKDRGL